MQGIFDREYGVQATIPFTLFEVDGVDLRVDAVAATADTIITKNEGAEVSMSNLFTDEGLGYSQVVPAREKW